MSFSFYYKNNCLGNRLGNPLGHRLQCLLLVIAGLCCIPHSHARTGTEAGASELSAAPVAALSNTAPWQASLPNAKLLGTGELRWFGFKIYSASLWSEQAQFNPQAGFALELTYHRTISREQFVSTSIDEIRRIFGKRFSEPTLQRWETAMQTAFTSVKSGDQLIGVNLPARGCRFFSKTKLLAEINDPEFAEAFFAIWFHEQTKDTDLRNRLLGKNAAKPAVNQAKDKS